MITLQNANLHTHLYNIFFFLKPVISYVNMPAEKAIEDFRTRIAQYERTYETIDEEHLSYIKLIDVGKTMVANNINNYIAGRVVFFLMNLHIGPRPIYISRHGQSEFNTLGKLGGNSDITDIGDKYARSLADWLADNTSLSDNIVVWTSTLKRCAHMCCAHCRLTHSPQNYPNCPVHPSTEAATTPPR